MYLSILVPSRNRPSKLKKLISNLSLIIGDGVEVHIIESISNSVNIFHLSNNITYEFISSDISFAQKIKMLLKKANGHYIWIIGDDDEYNFSSLNTLFSKTILKSLIDGNIDVIDVNVGSEFDVNDSFIFVERGNIFDSFRDYKLPFILISTYIFKNNISYRDYDFEENIWIQNEVVLRYVGFNCSCYKINTPMVRYIEPEVGGFTPFEGYRDYVKMVALFHPIVDEYTIEKSNKLQFENCQKTILRSFKYGFIIPNIDHNIKFFRKLEFMSFNIIIYSLLLHFPRVTKFFIKIVYGND